MNRILTNLDGRLLISRSGQDVGAIQPEQALLNTDYANMRMWGRNLLSFPQATYGGGTFQTLSPISGINMAPKTLAMFRPSDGSKNYKILQLSYTSRGYLMAFTTGYLGSGSGRDDKRWGVKVEDVKGSTNINVGSYCHDKAMQVAVAAFHNDLG